MNRNTGATMTDALVIEDADGDHYVLALDLIERLRATEAQRAVLRRRDDGSRFACVISNRLHARQPFQVVGVVALPAPSLLRENPFWPGIEE